jgi:hypothetical protein
MNVAFLLGSGASCPAGMPTTADLTKAILTGDGYARHTDGSYFKGEPLYAHIEEPDTHVPHISRFLRSLECHVSTYYNRTLGRTPNYEDLYYLVHQVYEEEVGDLDNPFVFDVQREMRPQLCQCAERIRHTAHSGPDISILAHDILNYITCVVATELANPGGFADYLRFLHEALDASTSGRLSIFTLNHDLVLERFLKSRNVAVIDGFGQPVNSVRYWDPELLPSDVEGCLTLKLHGSINWFRFCPDGGDWGDERAGLPEIADIEHTRGPDGQRQRAVSPPLMLIGTFNKIPQYTGGLFSDLFCEFRRRLTAVDTLVVCGYGFGDKAINGQLIEWLYGLRKRRMLLVHPAPDDLRATARGAVRNKWDTWLKCGMLRLCKSRVEQITWQEMAAEINAS